MTTGAGETPGRKADARLLLPRLSRLTSLSFLTKVRTQGGRAAPCDLWIPAFAGKEGELE
ncbi:hypothetical protein GCM10011367_07020 [Marinicauda pacifica]|nr:hypothetical protein GCM10011367_07020 [Marinicauda pacifica]